jgi:5-methylcytosine-specific restriction endonuclease McrA
VNIIDKNICLCLNSIWQPINTKTVGEAVSDLYAGSYKALDISYEKKPDGSVDFEKPLNMNPLDWGDWVKLDVRDYDLYVRSAKLKIRVPTVLVCQTFSKMPFKRLSLTPENIRKRDNNTCQYTGKKLNSEEGSIDHVIPKSKGGENSWDNMVYCDKKLNTLKGDKSLSEANLKLIKNPSEPKGKPIASTIDKSNHYDWKHFLINDKSK